MRKALKNILLYRHTAGLVQRYFRLLFTAPGHFLRCLRSSAYSLQPTAYSLFLVFSFAFTALADVRLKVSPSRSKIYLSETFNLTIEVAGADRDVEAPDLAALPSSEVTLLGSHSNSRSSITITNGRMSRESFEGRVFAFQVKPAAEGVFRAGPIRVKVAGKTYTNPGATVQVSGIEKQDTVVAAVSASSTSVLVEEPFTVTLSVAVAELPDPYAESNEPLHPNALPHLSADFLEVRQDLAGLKGPDINQILNGLIDQSGRQPSFAINNYQTRDFGGFGNIFGDEDPFKPRPIRFRLAPSKVTINGKKYRQYTLSLPYTPTKEGEYTFGPAVFRGTVISDVSADRQAVTKDVYTIGPAVTVRVVPPPDEGRPEWFVGTVGKSLKATAAFDATTCKVGDPLTLTLELTGPISISNLRTPLLSLQPELSKDFRIYDDNVTAETQPDGKRFKYRVRPTREGTLEFPPIKLAYYDTGRRAYATVSTAPIPIQARATTQIATAAEKEGSAATGVLEGQSRPLPAGITLSAQAVHTAPLLPPPAVTRTLLFAGPALGLLAVLLSPLAAGVRALRAYRLRSGALHRARGALRRAAAPDLAARAVRSYLADRLEVAGNALTPSETAALLRRRNVSPETAEACSALLARLDEAMYRPNAAEALSEIVESLHGNLADIDAAIGAPPPAREEEQP